MMQEIDWADEAELDLDEVPPHGPPDNIHPWFWDGTTWVLAMTDTDDGVPKELELEQEIPEDLLP